MTVARRPLSPPQFTPYSTELTSSAPNIGVLTAARNGAPAATNRRLAAAPPPGLRLLLLPRPRPAAGGGDPARPARPPPAHGGGGSPSGRSPKASGRLRVKASSTSIPTATTADINAYVRRHPKTAIAARVPGTCDTGSLFRTLGEEGVVGLGTL